MAHKLPQVFLYVLALTLEIGAAVALFCIKLDLGRGLLLLCVHVLSCVLFACSFLGLLPKEQRPPRFYGGLFLVGTNFFIPVLGALGMLGGLLARRHSVVPKSGLEPAYTTVQIPDLPSQPPSFSDRPAYDDGALSAMLRYCHSPERRMTAVLAVRRLRDRHDVEVLRLALHDAVDDVRLLAYAILDRKEQSFNVRQRLLANQLDRALAQPTRQPGQIASLRKRLSQAHLERIQLGLAQGEVQNFLLDEARKHISAALVDTPEDCESLHLLGQLALLQGDLDSAEQALLAAQRLGMAAESVLPVLAEVAFRKRHFEAMAKYLRAIDGFYFLTQPLLRSIAAHWLPEEY